MEYLLISILCLSVYFLLRALYFVVTYIDLYNHRDTMCIEHIVKQQKACDLLNTVYQVFVVQVSLHIAIECLQMSFNENSIRESNMGSIITISICYIIYFILIFRMETKHHLGNFYNHMIDYRSKQKVVTRDNDNEVRFIRSYQIVMKHKRNINILYLASLAVLLYILH